MTAMSIGSTTELNDDEERAWARLLVAGNGDPVGTAMPEDDAYQVVMFDWGHGTEPPYGKTWIGPRSRRYVPVDHGTALTRYERHPGDDGVTLCGDWLRSTPPSRRLCGDCATAWSNADSLPDRPADEPPGCGEVLERQR
jgi:hypothetical protein